MTHNRILPNTPGTPTTWWVFLYGEKRENMPIYKRCSRCGKRLPTGTTCECVKNRHREYDRYSRDKKAKEFYHSGEWERTRAAVIDMDGGIDVYLFMTTGEVVLADTVHHIVPLRDDWSKRMDAMNLMSLNHNTHSMIEQMYKDRKEEMIEKLTEMLIKYRTMEG